MSVKHIFIALSIPALVLASGGETGFANKTLPTTTNKTLCSKEQWTNINEKWQDIKTCSKGIVHHYLHKNVTFCTAVADLQKYTKIFLNSTKCLNRTKSIEESLVMFIDLINITISEDSFRDFVKSNGSRCINSSRDKISKCIASEEVRNHTHFDHRFWISLKFETVPGCDAEARLKSCVDAALKDNTATCNNRHIDFFDSIVNFVRKHACSGIDAIQMPQTSGKKLGSSANELYLATNLILSTLAVVAFL